MLFKIDLFIATVTNLAIFDTLSTMHSAVPIEKANANDAKLNDYFGE